MSSVLVVPELHLLNYPFFLFLSLFRKIEVLFFGPFCAKLPLWRIKIFSLNDHLGIEEALIVKDQAYESWSQFEKNIPQGHWNLRWSNRDLDLTLKLKQGLGLSFERFFVLAHILKKEHLSAVFFQNLTFGTLINMDPKLKDQWSLPISRLSWFGSILDRAHLYLFNFIRLVRFSIQLFGALFQRWVPKLDRKISILWDGVNSDEMVLGSDRRDFTWILNGERVRKSDLLFLLPMKAPPKLRAELDNNGFLSYTLSETYSRVPLKILLGTLFGSWTVLVGRTLLNFPTWTHLTRNGYLFEIIRYEPLLRYLQTKVYVESIAQIGHEGAQLAYLSSIDVRTVLYCFSANSYFWMQSKGKECRFRSVLFSNIMADEMLCWHENYIKFIQQHSQPRCQVKPWGPLMPGDETAMISNRKELRKRWRVPNSDKCIAISFFDVAPVAKGNRIPDLYPSYYTTDYVTAFFEDMLKLAEEFKDVILIYKPKRALTKTQFDYSEKFIEMRSKFESSGRGVVIEDGVNPWIPIALSDISIGIPFTSPVLAAMHFDRFGIFHDPTGIVNQHRYETINDWITQDYASLRNLVQRIIKEPKTLKIPSASSELIGSERSSLSNKRFQDYLNQAVTSKN